MPTRGLDPQATVVDAGSVDAHPYREFARVPSLSAGIYRLDIAATDTQEPHLEDEVYVVVEGRCLLDVDGERVPVGPGTVAFVPAGMPHRFIEIAEPLRVVVVFGPAEHSRST